MAGIEQYVETARRLAAARAEPTCDLPAVAEGTGQSAALHAAVRLAAAAEDDALEHLAAEEGVEDLEALRTAWLAADQRGDEVEAGRILARLEALDDLTDQIYAEVHRIGEAELDTQDGRRREARSARAAAATEAAIEAHEERYAEWVARGVLFDDLGRGWSGVRRRAEREAMERFEAEGADAPGWMEDEGRVVEPADRWEDLLLR